MDAKTAVILKDLFDGYQDPSSKGVIGELIAAAYLTGLGLYVARMLHPFGPCDLIAVSEDGDVFRFEVRTAQEDENGVLSVVNNKARAENMLLVTATKDGYRVSSVKPQFQTVTGAFKEKVSFEVKRRDSQNEKVKSHTRQLAEASGLLLRVLNSTPADKSEIKKRLLEFEINISNALMMSALKELEDLGKIKASGGKGRTNRVWNI